MTGRARGRGESVGVIEAGDERTGDDDGKDLAGGVFALEEGAEAPDVLAEVDPEFVGCGGFLEFLEAAGFNGGVDFENDDREAAARPEDIDAAGELDGGLLLGGQVGVVEEGGRFGPALAVEGRGEGGELTQEGVVVLHPLEALLVEIHADDADARGKVGEGGGGEEQAGVGGHGHILEIGHGQGSPLLDEGLKERLNDLRGEVRGEVAEAAERFSVLA
jgi:hypothetical protein